ncbi:MAG: hypothetical protein GY757_12850 [bacterium]|nr:hypothetical protein [bacterium]
MDDGTVEFLGRRDGQVKIRGYRIEIGAIVKRLLEHESVSEAEVTLRGREAGLERVLCAYVVLSGSVDSGRLREHLARDLPAYMIPSFFVELEEMPLNPNGKIDTKALPAPEIGGADESAAVEGQLEKQLLEIWGDLLQVEPTAIDIHTGFFEQGGHSLKAAVLATRIHKQFGLKILLRQLFDQSSISAIAALIRDSGVEEPDSIPPVETREYYPISSAQKRMYIARKMDKENKSYNMPTILRLKGHADFEKIEYTFTKLMKRHESLRTSFTVIDDEPVQVIAESVDFRIEVFDGDDHEKAIEAFIRPFELDHAPLLRVGVVKIGETMDPADTEHLLMVDMHHIISDGASHEILVREFNAIYNGESPPPLRIQYIDVAQWQNNRLRSGLLDDQKNYWLDSFKGEDIPELNIPLDFPRPAVRDIAAGGFINFEFDEELSQKLYDTAEKTGTTLFMLLFAAYNILLSIYAKQEDIVVGTLLTGRTHADLENVPGMFVNTVAIKSSLSQDKNFKLFLEESKQKNIGASENQDYPFDELVHQLGIKGIPGRNPLTDTLFTLNPFSDQLAAEIQDTALTFEVYEKEVKFAKFDLQLVITENNGKIAVLFRYSTQLFKQETIESLADYYREVLEQVTGNPDISIGDITLSHNLVTLEEIDDFDDDDFNI